MARRSSGSALVRSPARSRLLPRSAQASVLGVERNGTTEFGGRGGKIAAHGIELTELTTCFHLVRLETERSTVVLGRFAPAVLLDQQPGQREVGLGAAGFALQRQPELLFRARSVAGFQQHVTEVPPVTCVLRIQIAGLGHFDCRMRTARADVGLGQVIAHWRAAGPGGDALLEERHAFGKFAP